MGVEWKPDDAMVSDWFYTLAGSLLNSFCSFQRIYVFVLFESSPINNFDGRINVIRCHIRRREIIFKDFIQQKIEKNLFVCFRILRSHDIMWKYKRKISDDKMRLLLKYMNQIRRSFDALWISTAIFIYLLNFSGQSTLLTLAQITHSCLIENSWADILSWLTHSHT